MADEERERGGQAPGSRSPRAAPSLRCRTFDQYPNGHQTHRMTDDKLGDPIVHRRSRWVPIYVGCGLANRPTNQRGSLPALSVGELPFHFQENYFLPRERVSFFPPSKLDGKECQSLGGQSLCPLPTTGTADRSLLAMEAQFQDRLDPFIYLIGQMTASFLASFHRIIQSGHKNLLS